MKKFIAGLAVALFAVLACFGVLGCSAESGPEGTYLTETVMISGTTYNLGDTVPIKDESTGKNETVYEKCGAVVIYESGVFNVLGNLGSYKGFRGKWTTVDGKIKFTVEHFIVDFSADGRLIVHDPRDSGTVTYVLKKSD